MRFFATGLLAVTLSAAVSLHAQGPAFDCAKADGDVETLICKDAALGALDRKLDEVYKAATAKARDKMAATLRAEQRGWVKGRNECWKAQNVPDVHHRVVDGQHRPRVRGGELPDPDLGTAGRLAAGAGEEAGVLRLPEQPRQ